jgi:CBS domain-containing protein
MTTVRQLLQNKGGHTWCIAPDATVFDAIKMMSEKEIGALVVAEHGTVVGVLSERDYARKVLLKGRSSKNTPVRDIMTTDVIFAEPDQNVDHCMNVMTDERIRHLPVMEEGRLIGVVSIGDLVKSIISEQQETIEQLESYIRG